MTGQRSNQLNYAPAPRDEALLEKPRRADKMHTKSATLASVVKFARVQQGCGFVAHDGVRNRCLLTSHEKSMTQVYAKPTFQLSAT